MASNNIPSAARLLRSLSGRHPVAEDNNNAGSADDYSQERGSALSYQSTGSFGGGGYSSPHSSRMAMPLSSSPVGSFEAAYSITHSDRLAPEDLLDETWLRSRRRHMVVDVGGRTVIPPPSLLTKSLAKTNDNDNDGSAERKQLVLPTLDPSSGDTATDPNNNNYDDIDDDDTSCVDSTAGDINKQVNRNAIDDGGEYGSLLSSARQNLNHSNGGEKDVFSKDGVKKTSGSVSYTCGIITGILSQIPAICIACLLNLMLAIPFGVAYFPIRWTGSPASASAGNSTSPGDALMIDNEDDISGPFPVPGKEILGIRMCLFATFIGQFIMTFTSKFTNPICFQMVENVPFFHTLAVIAISQQGYGKEALSTLFFLFGLSSVIVGIVFYLLGRYQLGNIVYFFPNHVVVGCIGGIGIFIVVTAIEVTINQTFTINMDGVHVLFEHFHLFSIVLFFELLLRFIIWATHDRVNNRPKFPLLPPVFFCLITPLFYCGLFLFRISMEDAMAAGYFFPPPAASEDTGDSGGGGGISSLLNEHLFDIFHIIDFRTISWTAVFKSWSTMIALTAFSLIHVPINIPAFSISTDVDTDMNAELMAHGYSNALSGIFGGLPNYMTYSVSVLYAKSGGTGRAASLGVTFVMFLLFIIGPEIATFIPRCMAGTLLLHVGLDLFLEGVYDSFESYDLFEYAGIWLITIVMTTMGMSAALIAGIMVALATYAAQSIVNLHPIRQYMNASTLTSSFWTRCEASSAILDDNETGRSKIFIIQLQGHLFFGNITQTIDRIKDLIADREDINQKPIIVIIDFTLVVGMDSSAAHTVAKLKGSLSRLFNVEVTIFVTGSDRGGFPCSYALTSALNATSSHPEQGSDEEVIDWNDISRESTTDFTIKHDDEKPKTASSYLPNGSISFAPNSASIRAGKAVCRLPRNRVCETLDDALGFAEDILVARINPFLLEQDNRFLKEYKNKTKMLTLDEEKRRGIAYIRKLCKDPGSEETTKRIHTLFSYFVREEYVKNQILWMQDAESDCAKLLIRGTLIAYSSANEPYTGSIDTLDNSTVTTRDGRTTVHTGNFIGELGLVHGSKRFSTLQCASDSAVLYSISLDSWNQLLGEHPEAARILDAIVIRYLAHRVQHVSNRIVDLGGLPV